jgi:putative transposase
VLHFAPSAYYAYKSRPPSRRSVEDAELKLLIARIWEENFRCYGAEKIWRQLQRDGVSAGRDRVGRLMRELGISGVVRGKPKRTTVPARNKQRPEDLVRRHFSAPAPNRLWAPDITYVRTQAGFAYVLVRHRRLREGHRGVGCLGKPEGRPRPGGARDGHLLPPGPRPLPSRPPLRPIEPSQFLSVRYTERLAQEQAVISVGSEGGSYDNALAETVNGLYHVRMGTSRALGPDAYKNAKEKLVGRRLPRRVTATPLGVEICFRLWDPAVLPPSA